MSLKKWSGTFRRGRRGAKTAPAKNSPSQAALILVLFWLSGVPPSSVCQNNTKIRAAWEGEFLAGAVLAPRRPLRKSRTHFFQ